MKAYLSTSVSSTVRSADVEELVADMYKEMDG